MIESNADKYIVGICPHLDNISCKQLPLFVCRCADKINCTYKQMVTECLEVNTKGRINQILTSNKLTARGELARKILKLMKVEVVNE